MYYNNALHCPMLRLVTKVKGHVEIEMSKAHYTQIQHNYYTTINMRRYDDLFLILFLKQRED